LLLCYCSPSGAMKKNDQQQIKKQYGQHHNMACESESSEYFAHRRLTVYTQYFSSNKPLQDYIRPRLVMVKAFNDSEVKQMITERLLRHVVLDLSNPTKHQLLFVLQHSETPIIFTYDVATKTIQPPVQLLEH
jgi:hypothetical protein